MKRIARHSASGAGNYHVMKAVKSNTRQTTPPSTEPTRSRKKLKIRPAIIDELVQQEEQFAPEWS